MSQKEPLIKTVLQAKMAAKILLFQKAKRKIGGVEQEWVFKRDLSEEGFKFSSINSFIDKLRRRKVSGLLHDRLENVKAIKFNENGIKRAEEELKKLYEILRVLFSSPLK